MPYGMVISEKSAKRFAAFAKHHPHFFGRTQIHLHYCDVVSDYRTAPDPMTENSVVLARFEISKEAMERLSERDKAMRGHLPPKEKGELRLYKPFQKPSREEEDIADMALMAYLFGGKCRVDGSKVNR